jgi:hypothetical protein
MQKFDFKSSSTDDQDGAFDWAGYDMFEPLQELCRHNPGWVIVGPGN